MCVELWVCSLFSYSWRNVCPKMYHYFWRPPPPAVAPLCMSSPLGQPSSQPASKHSLTHPPLANGRLRLCLFTAPPTNRMTDSGHRASNFCKPPFLLVLWRPIRRSLARRGCRRRVVVVEQLNFNLHATRKALHPPANKLSSHFLI